MAFLYKNFVFSALTADLGDDSGGTDDRIGIESAKRQQFIDLRGTNMDRDAVLVIREERGDGTTDFEIVRMTDVQGNELVVERGHEGSDSKAFTTAARISNAVTAERASILGGIANTDLEPEGDRSIGMAEKPFMAVHARNVAVRHGDHEFTIKPQSDESITEDQDLLLPKEGGTIARLEDSIEVHPGCFSGSLCVEPVEAEVMNASARGHTSIGDGIYIISYRTESGDRKLKLARYNDGITANSLRVQLGLYAIPSDDEDAETLYRLNAAAPHTITVGGEGNLSFSDVLLKTVGDYETAEGTVSSGFTLERVNEWLAGKFFSRRPKGQFAAQKIYGQDVSADSVDAGEVVGEKVTASKNLKVPVLVASPGVDQDTTEDYEVGSIVYCTTTSTSYVCVDATEGEAKWRPMGLPPTSALTRLGARNFNSSSARDADVSVQDLSAFKRFYGSFSGESGAPSEPTTLSSHVVGYEDFKAGEAIVHGHTEIRYKSDTSVTFTKHWGGSASDWHNDWAWLWGEE